jgi:ubiquinone biosynthesis protein COQ4
MTDAPGAQPASAPVAPAFRLQPLRAARALRRLLADKEDTRQVFEIMSALNGKATPKGYRRLLSTVEGGRIAFDRPELAELLDDRAFIDALPAGSVGAAYRRFMAEEDLSAQGLVDVSVQGSGASFQSPHPYAWYSRRIRDAHDIWHVLTGYGRDILGEGCVVAFSHAQTGSTGFGVIAVAAAAKLRALNPGYPYARAVREAWRTGRRAAWLPAQDYAALLKEPLGEARVRLGVPRPHVYLSIPAEIRNGQRKPGAVELQAAA